GQLRLLAGGASAGGAPRHLVARAAARRNDIATAPVRQAPARRAVRAQADLTEAVAWPGCTHRRLVHGRDRCNARRRDIIGRIREPLRGIRRQIPAADAIAGDRAGAARPAAGARAGCGRWTWAAGAAAAP